jgi:hypothetical protein
MTQRVSVYKTSDLLHPYLGDITVQFSEERAVQLFLARLAHATLG